MVFFIENCCSIDPHRGGVARTRSRSRARPCVENRFQRPQPLVGVGRAGVDHGAAGQHQHQRIQRVVGVGDRAAGHPAGVVGHHTAEGAGDLAGRIRAELATEPGQPGVDLTHRRAGADPHPGAAVEDLDVPEVPPGVHQDAVGHRLAAQAGAAGPERHRHALGRRDGEQPADLGRVGRGGDHARGESEVRGVMAQRQPVGRPAADLPRTSQGRTQRGQQIRRGLRAASC